jgi:PHP domain
VTDFRGSFTPDDRAASIYHYLPFEVPSACAGVRLELEYDRSAGVLDLGLIDPLGWRGWSGGARDVVLLGPDAATPGYLVRGLPTGTWQVVLGLHRVPFAGVAYRVGVSFEPVRLDVPVAPPVPDRPHRRELPCVDGMSWLSGDLHAHTVHSDGVETVDELAARAAAAGLDFLAVTDHNTVSHHPLLADATLRYGLALLPGQELTTADGHANALGEIGWVDFRRPAADWVRDVADRGGLLSVNHPIAYDCAWRHPLPESPAMAEVWHSSWCDRRDGGALAWWQAHGCRPVPVGGGDWHRPGLTAPGSPTTWVACTDGDVLGGLTAGRTALSAGREAPVLLRVGDELLAIDADGAQLICPDGRRGTVHGDNAVLAGHSGAHVLETNDRTVLAIAN